MASELVLSVFPGIGLLDRAFEETQFCVVRGPDLLWGGDICRFHPPAGHFTGVIGGPPCQRFSRLRHMILQRYGPAARAADLIPEFERVVAEAQPAWFLMENVPAAPIPQVPGYTVTSLLLNNRWVGGIQHRERRFSFGVPGLVAVALLPYLDLAVLEAPEFARGVLASGNRTGPTIRLDRQGRPRRKIGGDVASRQTVAEAARLQGLPETFFQDSPLTVAGNKRCWAMACPCRWAARWPRRCGRHCRRTRRRVPNARHPLR